MNKRAEKTVTIQSISESEHRHAAGASTYTVAEAPLPSSASSSAMQSEHRACTSRAFSSSGLMFSGAIASFTSGSGRGPELRSGLG